MAPTSLRVKTQVHKTVWEVEYPLPPAHSLSDLIPCSLPLTLLHPHWPSRYSFSMLAQRPQLGPFVLAAPSSWNTYICALTCSLPSAHRPEPGLCSDVSWISEVFPHSLTSNIPLGWLPSLLCIDHHLRHYRITPVRNFNYLVKL